MPATAREIERLSGDLEVAQNLLQQARRWNTMVRGDFRREARLVQSIEVLRNFRGKLDLIQNVCRELARFHRIRRIVRSLDRLGGIARDPETARAAAGLFGELFVEAGHIAELLPVPFRSYGAFLLKSGEFFTDMLNALTDLNYRSGGDALNEASGSGQTTGRGIDAPTRY